MNAPLKLAASNHALLREKLKQIYQFEDEDQALLDTLEGLSDFDEICAEAVREAQRAETMADGMKDIIRRNKARQNRLEARSEAIRLAVMQAMQEAGVRKIEKPDLTFYVRDGGRKMDIDETRLSHDYCRQIITWKPDRDKIKEAVDNGEVPEGVQILNSQPVLTVRS